MSFVMLSIDSPLAKSSSTRRESERESGKGFGFPNRKSGSKSVLVFLE
jgi:hypothetical protein